MVAEISTSTETSNGDQELVAEMDDDQELVDEWVVEIEGRLNRRPSMENNIEEYPSIIGKRQCWDDFEASFIPETQKWIYVACMKHYFGLNVRSYLVYMQEKVDLVWSYYEGVDQFCTAENNKRFIEHLLVNSCFLIFSMILLSGENKLEDSWFEIIGKNNLKGPSVKDIQKIIDFIRIEPMRTRGYMMTLNYQIPWFIVEAIYTKLSNLSNIFITPIHQIAYFFCRGCYFNDLNKIDGGGTIPEDGFKHLLHIFHWSQTPDRMYVEDPTIPGCIGLFKLPSATELELSQTVFKKDDNGAIGVSYCGWRVMQLTPWHLYNYTTKLFESLLRFEQLYGIRCGIPISSYVTCMVNLLKTEADVKVLRANDMIPVMSFDDKAVLRCVQELRTLIDDSLFLPNELANLMEKMMAHHKKSVYRVIGQFKQRYCSNPWIIISVIAGIILFILTFIQTVLSFIQTKYSVLSYKQ